MNALKILQMYLMIAVSFLLLPTDTFPQTKVEAPAELAGHWRGLYCKARATDQKRYGITGATHRDIGHEVSAFEFDVHQDGSITGRGTASYWFNAAATVNALVTQLKPQSYLEGKVQKRDFMVEGQVYKEGVFLGLKELPKLPFINVGRKSIIDGWNVFGPELAQVKHEGGKIYLERKGPIKVLGGSLEWRAVKEGLVIHEISMPSPEHSFISTDSLEFRARVEGQPSLDSQISWKGEDGKLDPIASGALKPAEQSNSPAYPKDPPLTPNPPPAPEGRKGKLSYKITAFVTTKGNKQETSVTIQQDELDQVRQEYVDMQKNRVPARDEFVQQGRPFNTGDYSWAIVNPRMVEGYQIIAESYAPHPAIINSAYRNPVHNANLRPIPGGVESRHIYGDAVDIQTVAVGRTAPPNKNDWLVLYNIVRALNSPYIEPYDESKAGHVHVDWRPKSGGQK